MFQRLTACVLALAILNLATSSQDRLDCLCCARSGAPQDLAGAVERVDAHLGEVLPSESARDAPGRSFSAYADLANEPLSRGHDAAHVRPKLSGSVGHCVRDVRRRCLSGQAGLFNLGLAAEHC